MFAWGPNARASSAPRRSPSSRNEPSRARARTRQLPVAVQFDAVDVSVERRPRDGARSRRLRLHLGLWRRSGQLGIGPLPIVNFKTRSARPMPEVPYPVRIPDLADVSAISAGNHAFARAAQGRNRASLGREQVRAGRRRHDDESRYGRSRAGREECRRHRRGCDFSVAVLVGRHRHAVGQRIHGTRRRDRFPSLLAGARGIRSVGRVAARTWLRSHKPARS